MSDDGPNRDGKKGQPTEVTGTGKELLDWLTPTSGSSQASTEQSPDGSTGALDRRSYMLLAGGAAAAAVTGGAASATAAASGTEIQQPEIYGYGGESLQPNGGQTTVLGSDAVSQTLTQTEENAEREEAMEIVPGAQVNATLEPATVDWFVFDAEEGATITVEYDRETSTGLTGVLLYGPDGQFKEKLYVATGNVHTVRSRADETGEHFVQVIEVKNGDGEYSFSVLLDEVDDTDDDDDESDGGDDESDDGDDDDTDDGSDDELDDDVEFGKLGYGEGPYGGIAA